MRRIEAVTGTAAEKLIRRKHLITWSICKPWSGLILKKALLNCRRKLPVEKTIEEFSAGQINREKESLKSKIEMVNGINFIA